MPLPPIFSEPIIDYLSIKIADACAALLRADVGHFGTKYPNIRVIPPQIKDELIRIPDLMIQNVIERDLMNRLVGKGAKPLVHVRFAFFHALAGFYEDASTRPADIIINELDRLDALLIQGLDGNNQGKLVDPDAAPDAPTTEKYLNERIVGDPIRLPPKPINLTEGDAESAPDWIIEYDVLVSFETHVEAKSKVRWTQ